MQIIDGRKIKDEILKDLKSKVEVLPFAPIFCDILVGDDNVSASYVRIKGKAAESVGIKFRTVNFGNDVTTEEIVEEIENLNRVPLMSGIIVQLPLPSGIDTQIVLDAIDPLLDVDCLGKTNNELFYSGSGSIGYPTALACIKLLESLHLDLKNKNILILGQGKLVGLPVTYLLKTLFLNVTIVNSKTENTDFLIKNADVIISAIGQGKFITGDMVKEGVVMIDAGTSEENGSIVGDVDIDTIADKASFVTPTPGGVGPVTVAMLLENVYKVAKNRNLVNSVLNE